MKHFIEGETIAFDTETTGLLSWHGDAPFAFSFANEGLETAYFEFPVEPMTRRVMYETDLPSLEKIKHLLEDRSITKVAHNMKFDCRMCEKGPKIVVAGPGGPIKRGGKFYETMFMSWCCNSLEINYKLKRLADALGVTDVQDEKDLQKSTNRLRRRAKKLGWKIKYDYREQADGTQKMEAVTEADYWLGRTMRTIRPDLATIEDASNCEIYARKDAFRTIALKMFYDPLMDELGVRHTYNFEIDLWSVVYNMEARGVCYSDAKNRAELIACAAMQKRERQHVMDAAWPDFNPSSPPQMQKLLYEKLKLPIIKRTKSSKHHPQGQPSVDIRVLESFRNNETVDHILKFRAANKGYGYFSAYRRLALKDWIDPSAMVLHSDFQQMGPSTGRLSARTPNLMQVTTEETARTKNPVDARRAFGPRKDYYWLHCDYKGQEVRIYADRSQEPKMLEAIRNKIEIHDAVANRAWGGKDNPSGIREAAHTLGLDGSEMIHNPALTELWERYGVTDWKTLSLENRNEIAIDWLKSFDWNIVKAQMSVGRKTVRNKAKVVFFSKIFGGGWKPIANFLECTKEEAQTFSWYYDEEYPGMLVYKRSLERFAKINGFIRTAWDRRLSVRLDKIYQCVNYSVQGTAADLLKTGGLRTSRFFYKEGIDCHLIMPIHDELVFEVRKREFTCQLVKDICRIMEDTEGRICVPMPVEPSVVVSSWHDKHKIRM